MKDIAAEPVPHPASVEGGFTVRPGPATLWFTFVVFGAGFVTLASMSSALVGYGAWWLFDWLIG